MSDFPRKCVVDTNVPIMANQAREPGNLDLELTNCVLACVETIDNIVRKGGLVLDSGDKILSEYRNHLSMSGQPGQGDRFLKWVHDHQWKFPVSDRVTITQNGNSYLEFPEHEGLADFDLSDKKFIAVANAHPETPPVFQATDSKWWGWKDALAEVGIKVLFLCPEYVEKKALSESLNA